MGVFDSLPAKHKRFCQEYLKDLNFANAAGRCGQSKRYAWRLSRMPAIKAAISELKRLKNDEIDATVQEVLIELRALAFLDPQDFFDKNGDLLPLHRMPEGARRSIASIDVSEEKQDSNSVKVSVAKKVKAYDKLKALEMLGKYLEMFKERISVETPSPLQSVVFHSSVKERIELMKAGEDLAFLD